MKRYEQYCSHLGVLERANDEDLSNEIIQSGIIDKFFIQFELGWKLLKDCLKLEGRSEAQSGSPRAIIKAAYKIFDFMNEEAWLDMLRQRNNVAHIYDQKEAEKLVEKIIGEYIVEFCRLKEGIRDYYGYVD